MHHTSLLLQICISIHAPREGGDPSMVTSTFAFSISIHAPREGGDFTASNKNAAESLFQSTPPARGATGSCCDIWHS